MTFHLHNHKKSDGRDLWLYSEKTKDYTITNDLEPVDTTSQPIARFHPLRGETVYYNPSRNTRTMNPPADYNPLAAVQPDGYPGEIPVPDFEVAIFENRWPGLRDQGPFMEGAEPAYGRCEVVVYSPNDTGSLADLSIDRVALLIQSIGDRTRKIMLDPKMNTVIPFENRGAFVGTTLPHPHGQIYGFGTTPISIGRQAINARKNGILNALPHDVQNVNIVKDCKHACTFCPEFARYPFETWIMPKSAISNPLDMDASALNSFAAHLRDQVRKFDTLFKEPMPYVMWHSFAPRGYEDDWPYHIQFWPLQRGEGKMKFLASIEQITGAFLVDVMPEFAAKTFREMPS
jgi:UDPglucose--hexose-1-phosphate uridylyltransferase